MKIFFSHLLLFVLFCFFNNVTAQEKLSTLTTNPAYQGVESTKEKSAKKVLSLPFIDDFSTGNVYPDEELWEDKYAYINQTMAVNPPTIGVATLDGLNDEGRPWDPSSPNLDGVSEPCDTLTSQPINLNGITNADSLYFSFDYQPQGLTGKPEPTDSLILEFKTNTGKWDTIWKQPGTEVHDFKTEIINVGKTPEYLHNNFQFRFRNYATPTGYNDFWHLDYIKLDKNRRKADTIFRDLAMAGIPTSIFNEYSVTTLGEFFQYQDEVLNENHSFTIKNLDRDVFPAVFNYEVNLLNTNDLLFESSTITTPAVPKFGTYTQALKTLFLTNNPTLPKDSYIYINNLNFDELQLEMKYYITPAEGDIRAENDTVSKIYTFSNQLGYDDGIVDLAYGVSGESSQIAQKYTVRARSEVYGVLIHFARININQSDRLFNLKLWKTLKGVDGADSNELLASREMVAVRYPEEDNHSGFALFCFEEAINELQGDFYIGIQQIGSVELNLGFDRNNDSSDKLHFNTFNEWDKSSLKGTVMMRPIMEPLDLETECSIEEEICAVFGQPCDEDNENKLYDEDCNCVLISSIFDQPVYNNNFNIFPNPVNDQLTLQGLDNAFLSEKSEIAIIDASGKLIKQFEKLNHQLFVGDLPVGMYFIRIIGDRGIGIQKFIKSE